MKLLTKTILFSFIITTIFSQFVFDAQCANMSDKLLRLHILANSDSTEDQNLKLKVRDKILAYASDLFSDAQSKSQAESITENNIDDIVFMAQQYIYSQGYSYKIQGKITKMYFNTRHYDNITLPAGEYDALRITIGEGKGKNWWCVMFPPMCFSSAQDSNEMDDVLNDDEMDIIENEPKYEYKFKAVEIFNSIVSFFNKE